MTPANQETICTALKADAERWWARSLNYAAMQDAAAVSECKTLAMLFARQADSISRGYGYGVPRAFIRGKNKIKARTAELKRIDSPPAKA